MGGYGLHSVRVILGRGAVFSFLSGQQGVGECLLVGLGGAGALLAAGWGFMILLGGCSLSGKGWAGAWFFSAGSGCVGFWCWACVV